MPYATNYIASLYLNGEFVEDYETTGNIASFNLSKRSDTENFNYTIKVKAEDGTTKTYEINVKKLSSDNTLKTLTINKGIIDKIIDYRKRRRLR